MVCLCKKEFFPLARFREKAQTMMALLDDDIAMSVDVSVNAEDRYRLGWQCGHRVLPYRLQDGFDRQRQEREIPVLVLENEHLSAIVAPGLGGRLLSLFDKDTQRELLDRNPVFQPANLALRNAWFSGGIEFNGGQFGHHHLTCSPLFATRIVGSMGEPALRVYEWDRVKCFPYQIDFHLPPGSRFLFTHVRIVNPHDHEIPMYWWTNMALPENENTRVLCPADTILDTDLDAPLVARAGAPWKAEGHDLTYGCKMPRSRECFFRLSPSQRPWEAVVEADGRGFMHVSTSRLMGRKVFYWGTGPDGRHWQEFLSTAGRSYLEIQAGLARTQMEHVPMPARSTWEWTEAFGGLLVDPGMAHSADWGEAIGCVEVALVDCLPEWSMKSLDLRFSKLATQRGDELITRGSGWGALERCRLAAQRLPDNIPAELDFGGTGVDQGPWLELLKEGCFPQADEPSHLMTQPEWQVLLERSIMEGRSNHWLAWWHLGNMCMENRDYAGARQAWESSLDRQVTGWALRNLAIATARASSPRRPASFRMKPEPPSTDAAVLLLRAWEVGPRIAPLAIEVARMLLVTRQHERLSVFLASLPASIRQHERIVLMAAFSAREMGRLSEVEPAFHRHYVGIREGETTLSELWFGYYEKKLAAGKPIEETLRNYVRKEFPLPAHLTFRLI